MKKFKINYCGKEIEVYPRINKYSVNDSLAIELYMCNTHEKLCNLTVNLPDYDIVNNYGFEYQFVDSNNSLVCLFSFIIDNKLGKITNRRGYSGYCQYPLVKFDLGAFI